MIIRWGIIILTFAALCFFFVDGQNQVMTYQMKIERAKAELKDLHERNDQMVLLLEQMYSPSNLLKKLESAEYGHLKFILKEQVHLVPLNEEE